MQCVKVGSMELHLNLFPFYVLLLLLSLSQGRPPHKETVVGTTTTNHSLPSDERWMRGGGGGGGDKSSRNMPWDELEENDGENDDDQARFKASILRELGLEDNYIPITPTVNISREEYMTAYLQYMTNVRRRKEATWTDVGPKRRRKNAIAKTHIFEDERVTDEKDSTTTFHFEMNSNKLWEKNIRVRRAELELDPGCRPLINATKLSSGENSYDLTTAVISWIFAPNPSPSLQVSVSCSSHFSTFGRLRIVTSELPQSRSRRSVPNSTLQRFKQNKPRSGIDCTKTRRGKSCCRRSLKIKFTDLGISEVIIEPQEFDAHVCVGRCNANRVAYSSTHALFQHILHQTKGKGFAPRPCCTPTKLAELDVIHVNSANPNKPKLEVTVLKDARVEECGCS